MFKLELNSLGFNNLVTTPDKQDGNPIENKLAILGHGWIDKIALKILTLLGHVFSSLKTVPIQLTEKTSEHASVLSLSGLHATRGNIERFLCKEIKIYSEKQNYVISESKILRKVQKTVLKCGVLPLKETIEKLTFSLDISTHNKMRKMINALARATPDLSTPNLIKFPFSVNIETGDVSFNESKDKRWVSGFLEVNDAKDVQLTYGSEAKVFNSYYLYKLKRGLEKHLLLADRLTDAITNFKRSIIEDEFSAYIDPYTVPFDDGDKNIEVPISEIDTAFKIDANKITLGQYNYIASSAPPKDASIFFWNMLAQQNSPLIVKLKPTAKDDEIYWPDSNEVLDFGPLKVKLAKEETISSSLVKRAFEIEFEGTKKTVHQLDFSDWPDSFIPDLESFKELLYHVDMLDIPPELPITVHCRAGIGRTGTFMAIHHAIKDPEIKIPALVRSLRDQRPGRKMVENEKQYAYIHDVRDYYKKMEAK